MKNAVSARRGWQPYAEKHLIREFLHLRFSRFVPWGLMAFAVLLAPVAANATVMPYKVTIKQQGNNVVATESGAIDLAGLGYLFEDQTSPGMLPVTGFLGSNATDVDDYLGFMGPTSFGSGGLSVWSSASGDDIGIGANEGPNFPSVLFVPHGYSSGTVLSGSLTWNNASFASLGVTRGTYTWTWGTGAEQSFTLIIGNTVNAPEPGALGMFGLGVLMIGAFVGLRRRVA